MADDTLGFWMITTNDATKIICGVRHIVLSIARTMNASDVEYVGATMNEAREQLGMTTRQLKAALAA